MPENTSGFFIHPEDIGNVRISEEVIVTIVSNTVTEIDGVAGLDSPITESLAVILGRKVVPTAIRVTPAGESMSIDISLKVKYGCIIKDLCRVVQKKVIDAVESMTGLKVSQVNIQVSGVSFEEEKKTSEIQDYFDMGPAVSTAKEPKSDDGFRMGSIFSDAKKPENDDGYRMGSVFSEVAEPEKDDGYRMGSVFSDTEETKSESGFNWPAPPSTGDNAAPDEENSD